MVERFNGRISDRGKQTHFASASELETTLARYLTIDNHHIPQKALGYKMPIQALKKWQAESPELFVKRVCNLAGLDSCAISSDSRSTSDSITYRVG